MGGVLKDRALPILSQAGSGLTTMSKNQFWVSFNQLGSLIFSSIFWWRLAEQLGFALICFWESI